ncbi:protein sorting system archaetidylserine synthase [Halorubrum gandharaense]
MHLRFARRLGLADAVTVTNAAVGFLAAVVATVDVETAARLVLFGAIADGLDGVVARHRGSTPAGEYLDSLADVASFCVAPAMIVAVLALEAWPVAESPVIGTLVLAVPALFVATGVARLGLYTAYDSKVRETTGVPTTLAATLLAAAVLTGYTSPVLLLVATGAFACLMLSSITYPDLHAQDALVMGVVQAAAVLAPVIHALVPMTPAWIGEGFAWALLFLATAYLLFGPKFYWENTHGRTDAEEPA